jgi:hypothetical protein
MNQILRKLYALYPAIGAWARSGRPSPLWDNPERAKLGVSEYVGPTASHLYMDSNHLDDRARELVMSTTARDALYAVVDAIYRSDRLVDGLFPEVPDAAT